MPPYKEFGGFQRTAAAQLPQARLHTFESAEDKYGSVEPSGRPVGVLLECHDELFKALTQIGQDEIGIERHAMTRVKRGHRPANENGVRMFNAELGSDFDQSFPTLVVGCRLCHASRHARISSG